MKHLAYLFARNQDWAAAQTAADPGFFAGLCDIQHPDLLWIGCSDSRVSAVEHAWGRGLPLAVHGWIYDFHDGLIRDLRVTVGTVE